MRIYDIIDELPKGTIIRVQTARDGYVQFTKAYDDMSFLLRSQGEISVQKYEVIEDFPLMVHIYGKNYQDY